MTVKTEKALLPWDDSLIGNEYYNRQSGYQRAVELKPSTIDGAGRGMFAIEQIKKGDCIRCVPLISYDDRLKRYPFEDKEEFPFIEPGQIIKIPNQDALQSLIRFFQEKSDDIVEPDLLRDFIATYHYAKVDGQEQLADKAGCDKFLHLGYAPMCVNHQEGSAGNVRIVYNVDTQYYEYIANSAISPGEEIFFDYVKFQVGTNMLLAPWYLDWQERNNVTSIVELVA